MANKVLTLKRSSEFAEIAKKGRRIKVSSWLTLQVLPSLSEDSYYGTTVSRKVGSAVVRNKLKRWVRNFAIKNWPKEFKSKRIVFVFRPQSEETFFKSLRYKDFLFVLNKSV